MSKTTTLNVTLLAPREKHPTVFVHFDQLKESEQLIIENDHDPKPLYYELLAERGDIFEWTYLEKGPEWFKVKIELKGATTESQDSSQDSPELKKAKLLQERSVQFKCNE